MTEAQRAVWTDFLCLAYLNDPPGQIDFTSFRRLANQLNISQKLLHSTIKNALLNGKIKVIRIITDQKTAEKLEDFELSCDQLDAKMINLEAAREKVGLPLYAIIIIKWNEYQSEYLRQKPYRKKQGGAGKAGESLTPNSVTRVTSKGEERRLEEIKGEAENPPNENASNSPLPSTSKESQKTVKDEFLELLRNCLGYPFEEIKDTLLFDITIKEYPRINILEQTQKKIAWWEGHPDALKADPRKQLKEWFKEESRFKNRGGPQKIGGIMPELNDPDHRRFVAQLLDNPKPKKQEDEGANY
jgi:hypothetical protein